jgi:hypothetical protein
MQTETSNMPSKIDTKLQDIIAANYGHTAHLLSVHKPSKQDPHYGRGVRHIEIQRGAEAALTGGSHTSALAHAGKILGAYPGVECHTLTITVQVAL